MKKNSAFALCCSLFAAALSLSSCEDIKENTLYVEGLDITEDITGKTVYDAAVIKHDDGTDRIVFVYSNQKDDNYYCTDGLTESEQKTFFDLNYTYAYPESNRFTSIPKLYVSDDRTHFGILGYHNSYGDEPYMAMYVDRLQVCQGRYLSDFEFQDDVWFLQYENYEKKIMILQYLWDGYYIMPKMDSFASKLEYADKKVRYEASGITDYNQMTKIKGNDFSGSKVRIGRKEFKGFESNGHVFYWK